MSGLLVRWAQRSADLGRALPKPQKLIEGPAQRFDALSKKLGPALIAGVQRRKVNLSEAAGSLRPQTLRTRVQNGRRRLESAAQRLTPALQRATRAKADQLAARTRSFDPAKLTLKTTQSERDLTRITQRLSRVGQGQVAELRQRLEAMDRLRETLSYKATLQRGYAVVRTGSEVITTAQAAKSAATLEVEFADGTVTLGSRTPQKASKKQTPPPEQGSLL
jgi:exodeoxyribonuclease VII large subunit